MNPSLNRIRLGAGALALVAVVGALYYRASGYTWLEAAWMVVVTISTVGYGERSQLAPLDQAATILLIVVGVFLGGYTFAGFIQLMTEGEIERVLNSRRLTQGIEQLRNHIIICGYGRMGELVAESLQHRGASFVIVESDDERLESARASGSFVVGGDATEEHVLEDAGIHRAATVVTTLPDDASNVFITLTARNLNGRVTILARANSKSTERKLKQAGADKIVMPTLVSADRLIRMITRPTAADLVDLVTDSTFSDIELDELAIPDGHALVGRTLAQTNAHRDHRILVVGVKKCPGEMVFNPGGSYVFEAGDTLIVMGQAQDIEQFGRQFQ